MGTRLNNIRSAVTEPISTEQPHTDMADSMWWKPERGDPNYYRLTVNNEPRFDVWVEQSATWDKAGYLNVSIEVVLYNVSIHHEPCRETIVSQTFSGYDQPREQAFLNNMVHYSNQVRETVEAFCETAEMHVKEAPVTA